MNTKYNRQTKDVRKEDIILSAMKIAEKVGLAGVRLAAVAAACGVSRGLVMYHFSTMTQLNRDIIRHAIKAEVLPIVAQALAMKDPQAQKAPEDLKTRALATLS